MNNSKSTDGEPLKKPGHEDQYNKHAEDAERNNPDQFPEDTEVKKKKNKKKGNGFDDWSVTWP